MLDALSSVVLGVIEGLTEFLPISSTAHLILASDLLNISQTDFVKSFEIAIQSGAILAVVTLYFRNFLDWSILKKILVAFIPTGIVGFFAYKLIKVYLIGNIAVVLWSLGLGGVFLIAFELFRNSRSSENALDIRTLSYKKCFGIGAFQAISVIPGVSRAAATIVGGLMVGMRREEIVKFSFLLAVPTMIAATGLDLFENYQSFTAAETSVLGLGFFSAFVTALAAVKFLLSYIRTHSFIAFGVYRILLALVYLLFML